MKPFVLALLFSSAALAGPRDGVEAIRQDPNYLEQRIRGVGVDAWGGPLRIDLQLDPRTHRQTRSIWIDRRKFSATSDPFAGKAEIALTAQIYDSESAAREAMRAFPQSDGAVVYAHYRGQEGIIFPTVISETTAPRVIQAVRLVLARERENADLASATLFESFMVLGGARFPLPLRGAPVGQLILESGRTLSVEEMDIAIMLVNRGHTVKALAEGATRTADFLVDGVATELKTVSKLTGKDLSSSLSRRILEGAGQAPRIIIDARRQAGMTFSIARRAIERAYGADFANRIRSIRVIGSDFDLTLSDVVVKGLR